MGKTIRLAATLCATLVTGVTVSGCIGPTYGTDKTATEQLVDDIGGAFSIAPKSKTAQIAYQPRPGIVKPSDKSRLIEPAKSVASKDNPNWVESPEEMRARLKQEADDNADNGAYRSPLMVSVTEGKVLSPEQQAAAYKEGRRIQQGAYSDRRRFLSDPPLEYRQVPDPSALTDLGESEAAKERRRKKAAELAGTGHSWWKIWE